MAVVSIYQGKIPCITACIVSIYMGHMQCPYIKLSIQKTKDLWKNNISFGQLCLKDEILEFLNFTGILWLY